MDDELICTYENFIITFNTKSLRLTIQNDENVLTLYYSKIINFVDILNSFLYRKKASLFFNRKSSRDGYIITYKRNLNKELEMHIQTLIHNMQIILDKKIVNEILQFISKYDISHYKENQIKKIKRRN
jgi:hypothetical protein